MNYLTIRPLSRLLCSVRKSATFVANSTFGIFRAASSSLSHTSRSSFTDSHTDRLSSNITYRYLDSPSTTRPLCLLFAWALSQEIHLEKFRHFWTAQGFDIITIQTPILELAIPGSIAPRNAQKLLEFLTSSSQEVSGRKYNQIVLHGFSLGAYALNTFIEELLNRKSTSEDIHKVRNALRGIILDSPGIPKNLHYGAAYTLIKEPPILRILLKNAIYYYYKLIGPLTGNRLLCIGSIQEQNPLELPTLVLYSADDEIVAPSLVEELINGWKRKDLPVLEHCWPNSAHVMHFKNFPEEYEVVVKRFLTGKVEIADRKEEVLE